jgi:serine/threonine protein phosphatase 1
MFGSSRSIDQATGPKGQRAYVVGDIHGRLDLLEQLLERIHAEIADDRPGKVLLVFLGDLIDRGPSSSQVVERLRTYAHERVRPVFLLGNHEEVLLRILGGEASLITKWRWFGGDETLASYGLDARRLGTLDDEAALAEVRKAIPESHVAFLKTFADTCRFGDYLFVHAGVRPGVKLDEQQQSDLRWIRQPFLHDDSDHGFVVVHGHSISLTVEERGNRIGIDTGAYKSGILTALAIEGANRWFLNTDTVVGTAVPAAH